jgi:hypothetical protein
MKNATERARQHGRLLAQFDKYERARQDAPVRKGGCRSQAGVRANYAVVARPLSGPARSALVDALAGRAGGRLGP